jgi:hypothetical protein
MQKNEKPNNDNPSDINNGQKHSDIINGHKITFTNPFKIDES